MVVINYFKHLFSLWTAWVFTGLDILIFYIIVTNPSLVIPVWGYWAFAVIGFAIANIHLFAQMEKTIKGYESQEANLILRVLESSVIVRAPHLAFGPETKRVKDVRSADGLDDQGLPFRIELFAKVEIENTGNEEGNLIWELNLNESELPDPFMLFQNNVNGNFRDDLEVRPLTINARDRFEGYWRIGLNLQVNDPESLAKRIRISQNYRLFLDYRTKKIGGISEKRTVLIEGDTNSFRDSLINKWKGRKLENLIFIAMGSPRSPSVG